MCSFQETDKATIDVEAQDDGVLAKIIVSRRAMACPSTFLVLSRLLTVQKTSKSALRLPSLQRKATIYRVLLL
jgi:hypothetical protein